VHEPLLTREMLNLWIASTKRPDVVVKVFLSQIEMLSLNKRILLSEFPCDCIVSWLMLTVGVPKAGWWLIREH
jgi:hypothetical protein